MDQNTKFEPLLTKAYEQGKQAVETEDWSSAVEWLKPVYQAKPDNEKITVYYYYAEGMLAYEARHWQKAYKNLQLIYEKDPDFKNCADVLKLVDAGQRAQDLFEQILMSVGEQRHIPPEKQEWDQIISKLEEAKELDPAYEEIPIELEKAKTYQIACGQFVASLLDLQNRKYKEALKKLESINESYHEFCSELDEKFKEVHKGVELETLWDAANAARHNYNWTRAIRYLQELRNKDDDKIYHETEQLLANAKEYERNSESQPISNQESRAPWWRNAVHLTLIFTALGAIAGVIALFLNILNDGTVDIQSTETAEAIATETAVVVEGTIMAAANATETAIAEAASATAETNTATETAVATMKIATSEANAIETAIAAASAMAEAKAATETAEAAMESAAETAIAAASATAAGNVTDTPTFTPIPTPTPNIRITNRDINLRDGPGTNYLIIGILPAGTEVEIIDRNDSGDWFLIEAETASQAWISDLAFQAPPTSTPMPRATPAPSSDAMVVANRGIELRTGPGEGYDLIAKLQNGTALKVLRTVIGNNEWIKVSTNSGAEIIEGYVTTAPEAIQLNIQLTDLVPIYEFGPHLQAPRQFETRSVEGFIEFIWHGVSLPLEEHQWYSLILVLDGLSDEESCYHWQTKETAVTFTPQDYGCTSGAYHWGVGVATDLTEGENIGSAWRDDSQFDERNPIGLGIPHPDRPEDSGNGGGDCPLGDRSC